jgi:hypothetical protein
LTYSTGGLEHGIVHVSNYKSIQAKMKAGGVSQMEDGMLYVAIRENKKMHQNSDEG